MKRSRAKTASRRPGAITIERNRITAAVRRTIRSALESADRISCDADAIRDIAGEFGTRNTPDRVQLVAEQIRAVATDVLDGAAALRAAAERLETWAECATSGADRGSSPTRRVLRRPLAPGTRAEDA